jgi:lysophospholipase L1-like esterase
MNSVYNNILKTGLMLLLLMQTAGCAIHKSMIKKHESYSILGLGDSITEGGPEFSSYLFPLDSLLKKNGYAMQFIGPRVSTYNGDSIHHAGFSGKTAEYLAKTIDSIYAAYPADIVLLHSGHNHFDEEAPIAGIIAAQKKIIQVIKNRNSRAMIFVAAVITAGKLPKYAYIPALNEAIKKMVEEMKDASVVFVNQQQHWDWNIHTIADKVHPNKTGAMILAGNWLEAIRKKSI